MSKRGCLGTVGFFAALALLLGFCSVSAFSLSRQAVLDLNSAGFRVDDPLLTIRCAGFGDCEALSQQLGQAPLSAPVLALTPLVTAPPATGQAPAASPSRLPPTALPTVEASLLVPGISDPRALTILLMGIDQRSATAESGPFRSDTMILLNINPAGGTVGLLSLPRDLWVDIPNYEPGRINTANFLGDRDAYPGGGGAALAMATVAHNFGLRVEHYLLVNFDVFLTLVDVLAPEGVRITVDEFIDDPDYPDDHYGTIAVQFQPGEQRMDAETLLQYARTRATEGGDFDRARRQQQVLDGLRAEVLSAGGVLQFISQAPRLWQELQGNYKTNLELTEILSLAGLAGRLEREDIHYAVVDNFYTTLGLSPQGEQVLYPDMAGIQELIMRSFYPEEELSLAQWQARAAAEAVPISIYNGTTIQGLAGDVRDWLLARGVAVSAIDNDNTNRRLHTEIRVYGAARATGTVLAQLLGLPADRLLRGADGRLERGIVLALGADAPALIAG